MCLVVILPICVGASGRAGDDTADTTPSTCWYLGPDDTSTETGLVEDDLAGILTLAERVGILCWSGVQNAEFEIQEITET